MSETMLIWCMLGLIGLGRGMAMTIVQEVSLGDMAILRCPSNDDNHRFQFWELSTRDIIGPGNNVDKQKYKYEVLTGTLYIKGVSTQEKGVYTCISKHLDNPSMSAKSVELVVRQNWETVYEEDSSVRIKFRLIYCGS
uniref:Ig-like domain-containing protein n=2 Tax=Cacopsylla melanoneura TaxID=428564 RepID=A0A8D8U7N8_9HEMI